MNEINFIKDREAERLKCSHVWRDAAADGPARNCLNCGQTEVEED
jgi:hypothetical protein